MGLFEQAKKVENLRGSKTLTVLWKRQFSATSSDSNSLMDCTLTRIMTFKERNE